MAMHQSILSYRGSRYFWWALLLCVGAIVAYAIDDPTMPPNGGTWLGYTLGTISALLILLLMWFGIRKRRYRSRMGTVVGWLSAHVYLGLALIVLATLHTGFQFGWNIHTLAYALMMLVIVSGIYGVYCYSHFPTLMTDNSGESAPDSLLRQIQDIDRQALTLASEISDETHERVLKSIRRTRLGGGVLKILFGKKKNPDLQGLVQEARIEQQRMKSRDVDSTMAFMASRIANEREDSSEMLRQLTDLLIGQKERLLEQLRRDMQLKAYLDLWLYIHVPMSFALLAALTAHIVSVFFYW
ncbi:MAG: hypothetical protein WBN96_01030 [Gammaproteobacteria bacterium]